MLSTVLQKVEDQGLLLHVPRSAALYSPDVIPADDTFALSASVNKVIKCDHFWHFSQNQA